MNYNEAETHCIVEGKEIRRKEWDKTGLHPHGQFLALLTKEDRLAEDWYVVPSPKK